MGEPRLVRVERFEELATGMRVLGVCPHLGCGKHIGLLGGLREVVGITASGETRCEPAMLIIGARCIGGRRSNVTRGSVAHGYVFRFAEDLGISDQLAAEDNPYTSRSVVGTNGCDEVVVAAKERTR